jgi:CRP/FNR family transcriptional regulator, cyclic AMP receptor protein
MRKALYFLGILDDADTQWLIRHGTRRSLAPGELLIEEGKPAECLYFVLDGAFVVSTRSMASVAVLKAGDVVGEVSFVDSRPPSASVRAQVPSRVGAVPRAALSAKLREDLGFAARFYRSLAVFLADRLRTTTGSLGAGTLQLAENVEDEDELASHLLEGLAAAGLRFADMQRREWGGSLAQRPAPR